jgi:hypothetical protein
VSSTKVRYSKDALNAEKDFRRHFGFYGHFAGLHNLWLNFLDATLDFRQICAKKLFLRSPLGDVSVEISQKKN